jgi:hypothetical protein
LCEMNFNHIFGKHCPFFILLLAILKTVGFDSDLDHFRQEFQATRM